MLWFLLHLNRNQWEYEKGVEVGRGQWKDNGIRKTCTFVR